MNWEAATFGLSVVVVVLQFTSLYTLTRIKLWSLEKFLTKEDADKTYVSKTSFLDTLHIWNKSGEKASG